MPPSDEAVEETLDVLDGLVFTGGPDLDPTLYDAEPHPETNNIRPERDRARSPCSPRRSTRHARLAICRGSQVLNVALGGDLEQHVPDLVGHEGHKETPGVFSRHPVSVDEGSRLHAVVGDTIEVSSHHHQGYGRLGEGLEVVARADDGTIEALEAGGHAFALGVLWHPEDGEDPRLFEDSSPPPAIPPPVARVGRWRTASRRSGSSATSRMSARWTASTSSSPKARSTASWDPTAQASPRPCTC